jgi:hypothetical protein
MGGGGSSGGGGLQQTNSNSTSTAGPNPYLSGYLQNLVGGEGGAAEWMRDNRWAPDYFPNGTVAPQSAYTTAANDQLYATAQGNQSNVGAGNQFALDTLSGKYLDPNSNTAFQDYLKASFRPQAEHFTDIIAPSINATFAGSGRTGGGAHFDTSMRGVQDLERSQSDAAAKAGLGLYQGERANQFAAAGLLPQFQNMGFQNIGAMQQAGANKDAYAQRVLDDQNAKYGYDQTAQLDWFNKLSQTLQSMYPGGQTVGHQAGTGWGTGGGGGGGDGGQTGQLVGGGIAAAGTIAAAFI